MYYQDMNILKIDRHSRIMTTLYLFGTRIKAVLIARYWVWRIPKDLNLYLKRWSSIDHRRDKSMSGKDFRLWYYLRKCDEAHGKGVIKDDRND